MLPFRALELDPSLAEAHRFPAIVKFSADWDWSGAQHEFKQALALNPGYATALIVFALPGGNPGGSTKR